MSLLQEFRIVYIPGARQAGKSTLIKQLFEETGLEIKAAKSFYKADFTGLASLASYAGSQFKQGFLFYSCEKMLPMKIVRD